MNTGLKWLKSITDVQKGIISINLSIRGTWLNDSDSGSRFNGHWHQAVSLSKALLNLMVVLFDTQEAMSASQHD